MPTLKREQKALLWGIGFITLGVVLILVVLYVEAVYHPTNLSKKIALQFFGHVAIASWILGIVGIIVEFKNWRDYFEERLASTIQKKEYLETLDRTELRTLLRDVFQAYYKVRNLVYEDSFLEFFNTKLQDYIAFPFREDVRGMITIHDPTPDDCFVVTEDISYKCRKVDVESSTIQKEIKWSTDKSDLVGDLKDYYVELQLPERLPKNFSLPRGLKSQNDPIVFKKGDDRLKPCEGLYGFELSIEEFKEIDELYVHLHLEYVIPLNKFLAWVMNYPSRGFEAIFHYPEDLLEITIETFGMESSAKIVTNQPGLFSLTYDSWLLPDYGLSYQFRRVTAKNPPATGTTAVPMPVLEQNGHTQNEQSPTSATPQSGLATRNERLPETTAPQGEQNKKIEKTD